MSPHILLILTDQFRLDGFSPTLTPNLHALSLSGTTFNNAYASTPTCTPSRAGILTGRSPWNHGMLAYYDDVDCEKYPTTMPGILKEAGYESFVAGKDHFGMHDDGTPITQGYDHVSLYDGLTEEIDDYDQFFDNAMPGKEPMATCDLDWNMWQACPYVYDEYYHPTSWTTRTAVDYIDGFDFNQTETRMFLKLSYHRPHSPYDPPARLFDSLLNDPSQVPDRFINSSSWDAQYYTDVMDPSAWHGDPGQEAARHTRAGYLANIKFVDEGVGQVLARLEEKGLADDFFVLWTSDHGDMNGDHNLWRKGYPWEASSHVPFVISPDKSTPGTLNGTSEGVVEMRDVAATLFDVAGVLQDVRASDPLMNGESLLPILAGSKTKVRDYLDLEHGQVYDETVHWSALVGDNMKFIFNAFDASEQLFNLTADPNETYDLAGLSEHAAELGKWRARMVQQFEEEGRGEGWVKDGQLMLRPVTTTLGPNYPCGNGAGRE